MSREAPVRFREGLGVQLPRATRLLVLHRDPEVIQQCLRLAQQWLKGLELKPSKTRLTHTWRTRVRAAASTSSASMSGNTRKGITGRERRREGKSLASKPSSSPAR